MKNLTNRKLILFTILLICTILFVGFFLKIKKNKLSQKPQLVVKIINQWPGFSLDNSMPMLSEVLSERFNVVTNNNTENYDLIIDGPADIEKRKEINNIRAIKIFYTEEAVEPNFNEYDLSIGFGFYNNKNYLRIPYYYMRFANHLKNESTRNSCNPDKEFFACFLVSNRYKGINHRNDKPLDGVITRDRMFYQLSLYKDVQSGGKHLNNIGRVIDREETEQFLSKCKFTIAYENQSDSGYVTEKVFQAYYAETIPLYYTDKTAIGDINKNAVIYAQDFQAEEDMVNYIKKVDSDDDLYCKIYNENLIENSKEKYQEKKDMLRKKLNQIFDLRKI